MLARFVGPRPRAGERLSPGARNARVRGRAEGGAELESDPRQAKTKGFPDDGVTRLRSPF